MCLVTSVYSYSMCPRQACILLGLFVSLSVCLYVHYLPIWFDGMLLSDVFIVPPLKSDLGNTVLSKMVLLAGKFQIFCPS